jgi:hypothetical protein
MLVNQNSVIHMLLNKIIQAVNQPCCPIPGVPCMARVCRALIGSCIPTWGIPPGAALLCLSLWESDKIEDNSYWEILYHILNHSPYYNLLTIIIVSPEFDGSSEDFVLMALILYLWHWFLIKNIVFCSYISVICGTRSHQWVKLQWWRPFNILLLQEKHLCLWNLWSQLDCCFSKYE